MTKSTKLHYVPRKWHTRSQRKRMMAQAASEWNYVSSALHGFEERLRLDLVSLRRDLGYKSLPDWLSEVVAWCDRYLREVHLPHDQELALRLEAIRRRAMSLLYSPLNGLAAQTTA